MSDNGLKESKGCMIVFFVFFVIQSIYTSISLIFGGNINETQYTNEGDEYTDLGRLKVFFIMSIISSILYLYLYWKKTNKNN